MAPVSTTDEASKPMGIIYPPPEVRNIVDKTASFVARNGPEFEQRIKQNEVNNPKFNFLNPGDPYNAYYQHKVKELRDGKPGASADKPGGEGALAGDQGALETASGRKDTLGAPGTAAAVAASQGAAASATTTVTSDVVKQRQSDILRSVIRGHQKQQAADTFVLGDPPSEFEFMADAPSISAFDLDVVKLTAQFVARNGRQFLTNLMNKEQRNYQFDFLRPQHSLFQYFTKLLEQYTKVLIPPKDLGRRLTTEAASEKAVNDLVMYRVGWIKHEEAKKQKLAEAAERERVSYAQIDWHNFVVVETVDYQPWEVGNFPPPTNPTEVGARVLMQRRIESQPRDSAGKAAAAGKSTRKNVGRRGSDDDDDEDADDDEDDEDHDEDDDEDDEDDGGHRGGANTNVEDMEEDSSEDDDDDDEEGDDEDRRRIGTGPPQAIGKPLLSVDAAPAVNQPPPALPTPGNVEVRKYDPKQAQAARRREEAAAAAAGGAGSGGIEEYLISPITGERIPASKVQEHMRIGLLDPRWVEERDKLITKQATEEAVFAPGQAIESSLKQLAERRTDIFGVGEEAAQEAAIGKKMGEEDRRTAAEDKAATVAWESGGGGSGGGDAGSRGGGEVSRTNISINEQIEQIHRSKGLLPLRDSGPKPDSIGPKDPGPPAPPPPPLQMLQQQLRPQLQPPPRPAPPVMMPPRPIAPPQQVPPQQVPLPQGLPVVGILPPGGAPPGPLMVAPPQGQPPFFVGVAPQMQPFPGMPVLPPGHQMRPPMGGGGDLLGDEPPSAKRARGEDSLMNEAEFMARNPSPVTFQVLVPQLQEKPEWRLNGQVVNVTLALSDTVTSVKARLYEETGMPPGKQKLSIDAIFLKDSNSLAFYNVYPGTTVNLQIKERGGRKK